MGKDSIIMNYRVLLVTAEDMNSDSSQDILLKLGFQLFTANGENEAMDLTLLLKPDLLLIDWSMSSPEGFPIIKRLKENHTTADIPVIVISSHKPSTKDIQVAFNAGAIDIIRKSYDLVELRTRIKSITSQSGHSQKNDDQLPIIKDDYELLVQKNKILELELEQCHDKLLTYSLQIVKYNEMNKLMVADVLLLLDKLGSDGCTAVCNIINKYTLGANKIHWNEFEKLFDIVNNRFFSYLSGDFPTLTTNEKKLCAYYRMNLSTKEIATLTYSSHGAVRKARNRLRKKIEIPSNVSLSAFLQMY